MRHFSRFLRSGLPDSQQLGIQLLRGRRRHLHLENFPLVDSYSTCLAEKISAEAAPAPKFRRLHQTALHRIAVHVAQFLNAFAFGPDVEIVKSLLPDMLPRVVEEAGYNAADILVPAAAKTSAASCSAMGINACTMSRSNWVPLLRSKRAIASEWGRPCR